MTPDKLNFNFGSNILSNTYLYCKSLNSGCISEGNSLAKFAYNRLIRSTKIKYLRSFLDKLPGNPLVLDIGSGKSIVPGEYKNTITMDFSIIDKPLVRGTALKLPFKISIADGIVHSWVLEHIEEPKQVIDEFYNTLKPGGYLYLTTNFVWHLHEEPRDFYRYTKYGLEYFFRDEKKWKIHFLKPTAGFWITWTQEFNYYLIRTLGKSPIKKLHPIITIPIQIIGWSLEKINFDENFCAGYCIIAQKK